MSAAVLNVLCAGAAQGLLKAVQHEFGRRTGAAVAARFGAVGAMKEALLAGEPCDVMIVTAAMVDALCASDHLLCGTRAALGSVPTGVAVRSGEPVPEVSTAAGLRAALLAAAAIHFPDPVRATAGIHFDGVMRKLGVHDELQPRFRTFDNGAAAMRHLAASTAPHAIGCTQVSEILYTPGVALAGPLPPGLELSTVYTAAVARQSTQPALAAALVALLAGDGSRALRREAGFQLDDAGRSA